MWIDSRPVPRPSLSEAIRQLLEKVLAIDVVTHSDGLLDRKIAEQKSLIAEMPEHLEPSSEAALVKMDKAFAEKPIAHNKKKEPKR